MAVEEKKAIEDCEGFKYQVCWSCPSKENCNIEKEKNYVR